MAQRSKLIFLFCIYFLLAGIEAFCLIVYFLFSFSESESGLFLGYSWQRLVFIAVFLLIFLACVFIAYRIWYKPQSAEKIFSITTNKSYLRRVFIFSIVLFVMCCILCLPNPTSLRVLEYRFHVPLEGYFIRLRPVLIWLVLINAQTTLGIFYLCKDAFNNQKPILDKVRGWVTNYIVEIKKRKPFFEYVQQNEGMEKIEEGLLKTHRPPLWILSLTIALLLIWQSTYFFSYYLNIASIYDMQSAFQVEKTGLKFFRSFFPEILEEKSPYLGGVDRFVGINYYVAFVDFYYFLGLFPLSAIQKFENNDARDAYRWEHPESTPLDKTETVFKVRSKEEAEAVIREHPELLLMEYGDQIRDGDYGKIWLFLPEIYLRGNTEHLELYRFCAWFFTMSLIVLLCAAWYVNKFPLGIMLCLFIGAHPFQIYEIYATHQRAGETGQLFSLPISFTILFMGLHFPLIFDKRTSKIYLLLLPIITGSFLSTVRWVRTEYMIIILSIFVIYLFAVNWRLSTRIILCILLLTSFLFWQPVWQTYFDNKINQVRELLENLNRPVFPTSEQRIHHVFWHAVADGLLVNDKRYNYDGEVYGYALPIMQQNPDYIQMRQERLAYAQKYPDMKYYPWFPQFYSEYDGIIRDKVISDIRKDPVQYLHILAGRIVRVFGDTAPLELSVGSCRLAIPFSGWLFFPTILIFIFIRLWVNIKLICFSLPLAITALIYTPLYGTTHYSIFPQVIAAVFAAAIWDGASIFIHNSLDNLFVDRDRFVVPVLTNE